MSTTLRQRMLQDLQLAGLSERTQEAYLRAVRLLAEHFHTPPDQLHETQIREYFLHLKNDRKFASASLGIAYSGIKFFYSHTCPRDWPTLRRLRVRREKRLPMCSRSRRCDGLSTRPHASQPRLLLDRVLVGPAAERGVTASGRGPRPLAKARPCAARQGAKDRYVPLPGAPWTCCTSTGRLTGTLVAVPGAGP